jgi:hypothetical protein
MHHNDARRAFSCPGRDSFIGGNVISDRFNRFCPPPALRAEGPHAEGSIEVVQRNDRSKFFLMCSFAAAGMSLIGVGCVKAKKIRKRRE